MKNPLHYQLSEYDCGPTAMLDAISFLFPQEDILLDKEHPFAYNRIVPEAYFNQEDLEIYALGPMENREAVLLFNEQTRLTADKTIEYYI